MTTEKQKRIGFSILGQDRDSQGGEKRRWKYLRPSVALATQEEVFLDRHLLIYQPGQEELLRRVRDDASAIHAERRRECELTEAMVAFDDPFDFDGVLKMLVTILEENTEGPGSTWYLNLGTGTHAMQFAMYLIADKQWLTIPAVLAQPTTGGGNTEREKTTFGSSLRIISLDWPETLQESIRGKREKYVPCLLPTGRTNNSEWHKSLELLGALGAETDEALLLLGETGTGKTQIAEKIHALRTEQLGKSPEERPFRAANCATLRGDLARSELFGHVKGAFTGAVKDHVGVLQQSDGGTLFLDELGEMEPETQAMLLTAIETRRFSRLGDVGNLIKSEFRLICATNRDLANQVRHGRFRLDLYARIRTWTFPLPALRALSDDMDILAAYELSSWQNDKRGERRSRVDFSPEARELFMAFATQADWPGNYRDFAQSIRRLAMLASIPHYGGTGLITGDLVKAEIDRIHAIWDGDSGSADLPISQNVIASFVQCVQGQHKDLTLSNGAELLLQDWALERSRGNKAEAGRALYETDAAPLSNPTATFCRRRKAASKS